MSVRQIHLVGTDSDTWEIRTFENLYEESSQWKIDLQVYPTTTTTTHTKKVYDTEGYLLCVKIPC